MKSWIAVVALFLNSAIVHSSPSVRDCPDPLSAPNPTLSVSLQNVLNQNPAGMALENDLLIVVNVVLRDPYAVPNKVDLLRSVIGPHVSSVMLEDSIKHPNRFLNDDSLHGRAEFRGLLKAFGCQNIWLVSPSSLQLTELVDRYQVIKDHEKAVGITNMVESRVALVTMITKLVNGSIFSEKFYDYAEEFMVNFAHEVRARGLERNDFSVMDPANFNQLNPWIKDNGSTKFIRWGQTAKAEVFAKAPAVIFFLNALSDINDSIKEQQIAISSASILAQAAAQGSPPPPTVAWPHDYDSKLETYCPPKPVPVAVPVVAPEPPE